MRWLWALIPSKAKMLGLLSAVGLALLFWVRRDAVRDHERESEMEDMENALDIHRRSRVDPDELRKYEGQGYRD